MASFSFINNTGSKLALAAVFAASLAACGGGSGTPTVAAVSAPVTVGVQTTTAAAATAVLANQTFSFPNTALLAQTTSPVGSPDLPFTKIAFSAATTTGGLPFTLTQADGTSAKGTMTFGSCIFTVTEFPAGTVLATPRVYTIPTAQCQVKVETTNAAANGSTVNRPVTYILNTSSSSANSIPVVVAADGKITVGGVLVGTGVVVQVTGAN